MCCAVVGCVCCWVCVGCVVIKQKWKMMKAQQMMKELVAEVEGQIGEVEGMHDALLLVVVVEENSSGGKDDNDIKKKKAKKEMMIGKAMKMIGKADGVYKEAEEGVIMECEKLERLLWRLDEAVMELEHGVSDARNGLDGGVNGVGEGLTVVMGMVGAVGMVWGGFGLLSLV